MPNFLLIFKSGFKIRKHNFLMLLHFIKKLNSKNISPSPHLFCIQWNSKSLAMAVVVSGAVFTCKIFRVVLQRTKRYWTRW